MGKCFGLKATSWGVGIAYRAMNVGLGQRGLGAGGCQGAGEVRQGCEVQEGCGGGSGQGCRLRPRAAPGKQCWGGSSAGPEFLDVKLDFCGFALQGLKGFSFLKTFIALKSLGLSTQDLPYEEDATITLEIFKKEV